MQVPARRKPLGCWAIGALVLGFFGACSAFGSCLTCVGASSSSKTHRDYRGTLAADVAVTDARDDAAPILKACGLPTFDKREPNNPKIGWEASGGVRRVTYKKANVELMFFVASADAGSEALVGAFPANDDRAAQPLSNAEVERRLPCAKGLIHR